LIVFPTLQETFMEVKVLGACCGNCGKVVSLIEEVARENGTALAVQQIGDMREIAAYGVMSTPAVVIDGKVVHAGSVPERGKVKAWLTGRHT
jgi:predicted thioredoxin/glutaredoxin